MLCSAWSPSCLFPVVTDLLSRNRSVHTFRTFILLGPFQLVKGFSRFIFDLFSRSFFSRAAPVLPGAPGEGSDTFLFLGICSLERDHFFAFLNAQGGIIRAIFRLSRDLVGNFENWSDNLFPGELCPPRRRLMPNRSQGRLRCLHNKAFAAPHRRFIAPSHPDLTRKGIIKPICVQWLLIPLPSGRNARRALCLNRSSPRCCWA